MIEKIVESNLALGFISDIVKMETEYDKLLSFIDSIDVSVVSVKMHVIHFNVKKSQPIIQKLSTIKTDRSLNNILIDKVISSVSDGKSVAPLLDLNIENDECIFYENKSSTDYSKIEECINRSEIIKFNEKDLSSHNGYAIEIIIPDEINGVHGERKLTAFTYFANGWKIKKTPSFFIHDGSATIEEKKVDFCIFDHVTFISMDDGLFVFNTKSFQSVMNYMERLEKKKHETLNELKELGFIHNDSIDIFISTIGSDKTLLKNLASTQRSGHYRNPEFKAKLLSIVKDQKLGNLKFDENNNIIIENNKLYLKEVITLLGDKRVKTLILENLADVEGNLHVLMNGQAA